MLSTGLFSTFHSGELADLHPPTVTDGLRGPPTGYSPGVEYIENYEYGNTEHTPADKAGDQCRRDVDNLSSDPNADGKEDNNSSPAEKPNRPAPTLDSHPNG